MARLTLFLLSLCVTIHLTAQTESWYINQIATQLKGETEYEVENGRIDIVTKTHAIEVERASNWKQAIGQSLWYAQQVNLSPGIILIVLNDDDWKMGIRLNSTLQYAGLANKVKVWYYPKDFNTTVEKIQQQFAQERADDPEATEYWLSENSHVRHNKSCSWYTQSKGRYCTATDGKACSKCGG